MLVVGVFRSPLRSNCRNHHVGSSFLRLTLQSENLPVREKPLSFEGQNQKNPTLKKNIQSICLFELWSSPEYVQEWDCWIIW